MTNINRKQKTKNKKQPGFTLIELLVAVFVLGIAFSALFPLVSSSLDSSRVARFRMQGEELAREGIEVVRNIRDGNFIKALPFNQSFSQDGDYKVNSSDGINWTISKLPGALNSNPAVPLYISPVGIFSHDEAGAKTIFSRILRIKNIIDPAHVSLISEVLIDDPKFKRKVFMQELLFNWR